MITLNSTVTSTTLEWMGLFNLKVSSIELKNWAGIAVPVPNTEGAMGWFVAFVRQGLGG